MGYTHYINAPAKEYNQETWSKFVADCKVLYKNMPKEIGGEVLALSGCFKYEKPKFSKDAILFNGSNGKKRIQTEDRDGKTMWEDSGKDALSHETFHIERKVKKMDYVAEGEYLKEDKSPNAIDFSFCKTAYKPYDLMVTACLILYKHYFPEVQISSDGEVGDWHRAFKLIDANLPNGTEIGVELLLPTEKPTLFEILYK